MDSKVTCKYLEEACIKREKKTLTASHWMLYIILGVYIAVAIAGLICLGVCIADKNYECSAQAFVSLCGYAGVCGSSTIWAYVNKASKENEIKLSNDKYRMRLELAKEIFKEYGSTLDENSVNLLRKLMSDENVSEISPTSSPPTTTVSMPNLITKYSNVNDSEEGLG